MNYILQAQHGKKIAVIENEFGEVAVDGGLVVEAGQEIYETQNGWYVFGAPSVALLTLDNVHFCSSLCCKVDILLLRTTRKIPDE